MNVSSIEQAVEHFKVLATSQQRRVQQLDSARQSTATPDKILIAIVPGDGIGPIIMQHTVKVLETLLATEIAAGKLELRFIEGMTLENRQYLGETVPAAVMQELCSCSVILKGPTSTPSALDSKPMESANVTLRRELDLFANIRPIQDPSRDIDWTLFRENTEGGYILGSQGVHFQDWALDFTVTSAACSRRIARAAFEYAHSAKRRKVSIVTKANIIKASDGLFLATARQVAKDYPHIEVDDWYVDIMAANLVNEHLRSSFDVLLMPNLYGDILSDEAAQIQGGVGSAGSANIGEHYAMFEAVHGSAPRLIEQGLGDYADPSGLLNAAVLMLEHLGYAELAAQLKKNLAITRQKVTVNGTKEAAPAAQLVQTLLSLF